MRTPGSSSGIKLILSSLVAVPEHCMTMLPLNASRRHATPLQLNPPSDDCAGRLTTPGPCSDAMHGYLSASLPSRLPTPVFLRLRRQPSNEAHSGKLHIRPGSGKSS